MDCQQSSRGSVALRELLGPVRSEGNRRSAVPNRHGWGRKYDVLHHRSSLADRFELAYQRMGGIDFVVPVGADQEQVLHIRPGQQIIEQIERCRIEPLQVVEEESERMLRPREYADKSPKHQLEAALRVLWRKFRDRRLFSYDELQFGD